MRSSLWRLCDDAEAEWHWNFGLTYERLLMFAGAERDDAIGKDRWLAQLENTSISSDYSAFYKRWRDLLAQSNTRTQLCKATSRLFIGHGNPSGSDVGLTVHRTWGVPMIPGSALKGLLAHYIASHYGPLPHEDDAQRAAWRGVEWERKRIVRGPGTLYRFLFGAPDADLDEGPRGRACAGAVAFHDALYVPEQRTPDRPFARDVLTVHQKRYYDSGGATEPNDYDNPNPVGFINVAPGAMFMLAVTGPDAWIELAMSLLIDALHDWGIGGKTSLGYGRFITVEETAVARSEKPPPDVSDSIPTGPSALLEGFKASLKQSGAANVRDTLTRVVEDWRGRLLELDETERRRAANALKKKIKGLKPGRDGELIEQVQAWMNELRGGDSS